MILFDLKIIRKNLKIFFSHRDISNKTHPIYQKIFYFGKTIKGHVLLTQEGLTEGDNNTQRRKDHAQGGFISEIHLTFDSTVVILV